jgi:hypothetical protein
MEKRKQRLCSYVLKIQQISQLSKYIKFSYKGVFLHVFAYTKGRKRLKHTGGCIRERQVKRYASQLAPGKNPITYFRGGLLAAQVSVRCDGNK